MPKPTILTINCGSSSLKFALYEAGTLSLLAEGIADGLGGERAYLQSSMSADKQHQAKLSHSGALDTFLAQLSEHYELDSTLAGVGHRVVHGGEQFKASTLINEQVLSQIEECIPLAPLHNPANLNGIKLLSARFPSLPQVAVFDTAFHQTMPPTAYVYALPYTMYKDLGVRRYGFHGSSHRCITLEAATLLKKPVNKVNLISAHLGNGASVAAIKDGESVDTSMGMTPLEGLVMGTRSGDIDPGLYDYLLQNGYQTDDIYTLLNKESGLLGVSGLSNDMRTLIAAAEQGNAQAALAIDIFCKRLAKYIGSMLTSLEHIDALVFTGGIGENATLVRSKTVAHLKLLGFELDAELNTALPRGTAGQIHATRSHPIMVIPTDEEKMIALDTQTLI